MALTDQETLGKTNVNARSVPSTTTGVGRQEKGTRRVELSLSGLICANCVQAVERSLKAVRGVKRATVNLAESPFWGWGIAVGLYCAPCVKQRDKDAPHRTARISHHV